MNTETLDASFHDEKSDFSHPFGSYFPIPFIGFGIVMILGGLYELLSLSIYSILLLPIGIVFVFAKKGTTVSFSLGKYEEYFGLFKWKWGAWKSLPMCEYISVFSAVETQEIWAKSQTTTLSQGVIFVNLIHSRNQRLSVYKTDNLEKAFKVAQLFADNLNLDIFDATNREKNWIRRGG